MNVDQAIQRARAWVEQQSTHISGFHGAFLAGSLTRMPPNTPLEPWRDVDVVVVTTDPGSVQGDRMELSLDGIIIECGVLSDEPFRSPEGILSSAEHADNLAAGVILADPTGSLQKLHTQVAAEYARRRWVQARCDSRKEYIGRRMRQAREALAADNFPAVFMHFYVAMSLLVGLTAQADAKPLTLRRGFVLSGALLESWGRADLHEEALALLGSAHLSREEVEQFLAHFDEAFELAVRVKRKPIHYDFKFQRHLRPYYVDGTREMLREGRHREAIYWIIGYCYQAWLVLLNDAPEALQQPHLERLVSFFEKLDVLPTSDWASRLNRLQDVVTKFSAAIDERIRTQPGLFD
ncbi:hypothetical protein [Corallococcus macrosporus]|uniref:Polymerase nucleotidyl transferase domain-containing protein n=1 Tax=Myxococcus fulvus (strain ATCC BAA-855 / HW-1) TaxID=483219 RepID=F8CLT0_MYXFH|nr:hypothetical protein [Corallococcus macrosporus]AEI67789.1 hypothetical protein LILAB_29540 [Corallococcus macrosporus]